MNKIVIIGYFKYPFGSAGASRIRNIAKGLKASGADVSIITQSRIDIGTYTNIANTEIVYEGCKYQTSATNIEVNNNYGYKLLAYLASIQKSAKLLGELIRRNEVDAVIFYGLAYSSISPILDMCLARGIPIVSDIVEWMTPNAFKSGILNPQYWQIFAKRKFADPRCNGIIAITSYLENKYHHLNIPILRVPALFDFQKINNNDKSTYEDKNIFKINYVGGVKISDGIFDIIDAMRIIGLTKCPVQLNILGITNKTELGRTVQNLIKNDIFLSQRVNFVRHLSDENYMRFIESADALLLPRRLNTMTLAAFPTRLPELLSTGRPVITTSVPDVPDYLIDKVHAHVVEPGNANSLAERILFLWENPELANKIGIAGRERGKECFDNISYGKKIFDFINSLNR